jgi:predicted transcriptional regulator
MSIVKEEAIKIIRDLPEECTFTDIMAELYFRQKVEQGLKDIEEGRVISQEEVRKRMAKWAQSKDMAKTVDQKDAPYKNLFEGV